MSERRRPDAADATCYFDGACPGNQFESKGPMRAAYVIDGAGTVRDVPDLRTPSGPKRSNNIAEYHALLFLLRELRERDRRAGRGHYLVCGDSQLIVRQMTGEYRVRDADLRPLHEEARETAAGLDIRFRWVPRARNPAGHLLE